MMSSLTFHRHRFVMRPLLFGRPALAFIDLTPTQSLHTQSIYSIYRMLPSAAAARRGGPLLRPLRSSALLALSAATAAAPALHRLLHSTSSSSSDGKTKRRVCGMVILHRHGERAPMVNFYRPSADGGASSHSFIHSFTPFLPCRVFVGVGIFFWSCDGQGL